MRYNIYTIGANLTGDKTFAVTTSCYEQVVRAKAYYELTLGKPLTFSDCICMMADGMMEDVLPALKKVV